MKKLNSKKILNIIVGIVLAFYLVFGTDTLDKINGNVSNVSKESDEKVKVETKDGLEVHYIDVGQADSILIKNGDHSMLIDAGNNEDGAYLVNYFKGLGITSFDYVVATHAHEDHIGGMDDIIENFDIDKFYMPDVITTTRTFEEMLDALETKNMKYTTPSIGDKILAGDTNSEVIYVGNDDKNLNNTSIVLKLNYGKTSFLFTGDIEKDVEMKMLDKNLKSDVLKVTHHGSNYGTSKEFLSKVEPIYAIISVGKDNRYNHPGIPTINRLNERKIKTYRTDESGTIIATTDGKDINFKTVLTETNG